MTATTLISSKQLCLCKLAKVLLFLFRFSISIAYKFIFDVCSYFWIILNLKVTIFSSKFDITLKINVYFYFDQSMVWVFHLFEYQKWNIISKETCIIIYLQLLERPLLWHAQQDSRPGNPPRIFRRNTHRRGGMFGCPMGRASQRWVPTHSNQLPWRRLNTSKV